MRNLLSWLLVSLITLALLSAVVGESTRPCRTPLAMKQVAGAALAQYDYDANGNGFEYIDSYAGDPSASDWYAGDPSASDEPCYETTYSTSYSEAYPADPSYEPEYYEDTYYAEPYDYSIDVYPDYYDSGTTWYMPYSYSTPTYAPSTPSVRITTPSITQTIVPIGVPTGGVIYTPDPVTPVQPVYPVQPVQPVPPPYIPAQDPTCFISTYPTVINSWESASLSWGSERASAAYLSDFGGVAVSGGAQVTPGSSRTYTLTVTSPSGRTASCMTSVAVRAPTPVIYHVPSCYINVNPVQVRAGEIAGVSWGTTDATSAYLNGLGQVGTVGYYQDTPTQSRTYTLSVVGPGGTSSCSTGVAVSQAPVPPTPPEPQGPAAPTCSLSADTGSIFEGGSAKLTWSTQRATDVTLSGVGAVSAAGTRSVSPTATQKYTLTAKGAGGTRSCSVTVSVTSAASCTIVCNGVTYACAPVSTPVSAVCPSTTTRPEENRSLWQWFKSLF